ncbi:MAG: DUF4251 domain-containing protein [Rikenellaceae bacterium]|nr:DUF4251 domain-containing protein [Rikenellaceae bacterium]
MKTKLFLLGLGAAIGLSLTTVQARDDSRQERKARREAEAAATARTVDSILTARRFLFVPTRVVTQLPGMPYVTLNTYYEVAVTPDSLVCSLPYYGYVYNTVSDPDRSPFYFTAVRPSIDLQSLPAGKKKGWIVINAREQYNQRSYILTFETFSNGSASLTIQGVGTQHLQYLGNLFPISPGQPAAINPEMR